MRTIKRMIASGSAVFIFLVLLSGQGGSRTRPDIRKDPNIGLSGVAKIKKIVVTEPNEVFLYYYTHTYPIHWQCKNITQPLRILLIVDSSHAPYPYQTIAENVPPNQKYFKWMAGKMYSSRDVPLPRNGGDGFLIRVETMDRSVYGLSPKIIPFSILRLRVTSPHADPPPEYRIGDNMNIRWETSPEIKGKFDIELWKDTNGRGMKGKKVLTIAKNVPYSPAGYNWRVAISSGPAALTKPWKCQIKIRSSLTPYCLFSTSYGRFTFLPNSVLHGEVRR